MNTRRHARSLATAVAAAALIPLGAVALAPTAGASEAPDAPSSETTDAPTDVAGTDVLTGEAAEQAAYQGRVTTGMKIREAPTAASTAVGSLAAGTTVALECKAYGPDIDGNTLWYKFGDGSWGTARYIANVGSAPDFCGDNGGNFTGTVNAETGAKIYAGPNTAEPGVGVSPYGQEETLVCKVASQSIDGNALWYQLVSDGGGQWVPARFIDNVGSAPPYC